MRTFTSIEDLAGAVGEPLGPTPWFLIDQDRVNAFAETTGDPQWIHTDPVRAASGPFGGTVAHGYLTLSLLPLLAKDLYRVEGATMGVNYGLNRVRFPAPLLVGSSIRIAGEILSVEPVPGGAQLTARITVSTDRGDKPCCVAETVSRVYF
ncbi:MaoC family dehydratase [Luedemannella flava]|uniref:MaoC family dehydratase n=1 Tax=Luedemannella flava TaxID=349316 RepID=A0ABN2LU13_9ACTN